MAAIQPLTENKRLDVSSLNPKGPQSIVWSWRRDMLRILINKQTYQLVMTVVMKNCDPLVSGPAFAIDRTPVQGVKKEEWVHCPAFNQDHFQRRRRILIRSSEKFTWSSVLQFKVLISKTFPKYWLSTTPITKSKITALDHKAWNNPVKWAPFIIKCFPTLPNSFLPCNERIQNKHSKVLTLH